MSAYEDIETPRVISRSSQEQLRRIRGSRFTGGNDYTIRGTSEGFSIVAEEIANLLAADSEARVLFVSHKDNLNLAKGTCRTSPESPTSP